MLIPLFYYLSNPFLHRMTNFIPTAAPIFPPQLLLPRAARQVISPPSSPTTLVLLLNPPDPQGRVQNQHSVLVPCEGQSQIKPNGQEKTCAAPLGGGEWAADLQENKSHTSSSHFFVFLQLQGTSRDWRKTNVFTSLCPQDAGRSLPAGGKQVLRSRDRLALRAEI